MAWSTKLLTVNRTGDTIELQIEFSDGASTFSKFFHYHADRFQGLTQTQAVQLIKDEIANHLKLVGDLVKIADNLKTFEGKAI